MPSKNKLSHAFLGIFLSFCLPSLATEVHFLIMSDTVVGPISPYIYGMNDEDPLDSGATLRRMGGNRLTGYNWVNNASNAGKDGKHTSDNWLCDRKNYADCDQPGAFAKYFVEENQKAGMASLLTLPMAGYVVADKEGEVDEKEKAPSKRWKPVVFHKRGKFTLAPSEKAPVVYDDEFVNFLVSNFKTASEGGVKFYDLDNEPGLWFQTHPRIHPKLTGYWELANLTEKLAFAVTKVDPTAQILGPVSYGWQEFLTLQDSPDSADINQTDGTFLDFYLKQMKAREAHDGRRLMHILDLHWYPEAIGGDPVLGAGSKRITEGDTSPDSVEARLQAPRSLWDPGYVEKSWITQSSTQGKPIQLIPWLKEKIDRDYPGTGLGFSEYDFGAGNHISGGVAQADVMGIFGKYGVALAAFWGKLRPYNLAAFRLYRNYDGKGSSFGDTEVSSGSDDITKTSIYAATDNQRGGTLWVVVLNKDQKESVAGKFEILGKAVYKSWVRYGFDAQSAEIQPLGSGPISQNKFDYSLPSLTANLFVCR
jgi:mannan endo-1,4-beta-mannosidase